MSQTQSYIIAPNQAIRVKLGRSVSPEIRRNTLQTGSSEKLLLLAQSDQIKEADLHARYKQYRQGDGGTEFFNIPLEEFLDLYMEFQGKVKRDPSPIPEEPIDWKRVSPLASTRENRFYNIRELRKIAARLKIPHAGLRKEDLAEKILVHCPEILDIPVVKIEDPKESKSLITRLIEMVFS